MSNYSTQVAQEKATGRQMELLLFGVVKEMAGTGRLLVPATEAIATVGALKQWLAVQYPGLGRLRSLAVAVNNEYAADDQPLQAGNEIAIIPPVSGG
jgi:molybdopterin synthase sulfur carrier subunit